MFVPCAQVYEYPAVEGGDRHVLVNLRLLDHRFRMSVSWPSHTSRFNVMNSIATAPHVSATGGRFSSHAAVELFLLTKGLQGSSLSQQDAALASVTPNLTAKRFTELFGGSPRKERPQSREFDIICVNQVLQPYAPHTPGEPGVVFIFPSIVRADDDYIFFHLFANISAPKTSFEERRYRYLGLYTKVPTTDPTVNVDEWSTLPANVSALSLSHDRFFLLLIFCVSCSSALPGPCVYSALMCAPSMLESLYAMHVRKASRPHRMRSMHG